MIFTLFNAFFPCAVLHRRALQLLIWVLLPLERLINATVQKAGGFCHEYSNISPAYHFLCSVVTLGVGEAGILASKSVGVSVPVPAEQFVNRHFL